MSLRDIVIETDSVVYNGQTIPLRGISTNDVKSILARARNSADLLFNMAARKGVREAKDLTEDSIKNIANTAITELPVLISVVIAQSADDIESAPIVERLPASVQLDCLRKIARMTFTDATNFGEFLGNVKAVANAMNSIPLNKVEDASGERQPKGGLLA